MRRWVVVAVVGTLVLAGCGGDDDDDANKLFRERTGVFFHNQMIDTSDSGTEAADTRVDLVRANNLAEPMFEARAYSTTEQDGVAFKLDADTETVLFDVNTATTTLVDDTGISLVAGANYTLLLLGKLAGSGDEIPKLKAFRQTPASIPASQVRVRFIHALANDSSETVAVVLEGDSLISALGYGNASVYFTGTPSSSSQLTVSLAVGSDTAVARSCSIELGKSYDAIIAHPAPDSTGVALFCQQVAN